nr:putative threonine/serine exporter family protein [uncultured bacterium]
MPQWMAFAAMPLIAMGFTVLFRALPRDWPWVMLACAVGLGSLRLGQLAIGPILGASIGGLCVGLAGNIFARLARRPGSIIHTPGLLLLVPGSIGFQSFATMLNADTIHGIESIFAALLTAVSLTVGMILSSILIPPRNEL